MMQDIIIRINKIIIITIKTIRINKTNTKKSNNNNSITTNSKVTLNAAQQIHQIDTAQHNPLRLTNSKVYN